jgi:hypothetical protein
VKTFPEKLATAVLLVMWMGCGGSEGLAPGCTKDLECKEKRICMNGSCVEPALTNGGANRDSGTSGEGPAQGSEAPPPGADGTACTTTSSSCDPQCGASCGTSPGCLDICCKSSTHQGVFCGGQCVANKCNSSACMARQGLPWKCLTGSGICVCGSNPGPKIWGSIPGTETQSCDATPSQDSSVGKIFCTWDIGADLCTCASAAFARTGDGGHEREVPSCTQRPTCDCDPCK